MEQIKVKTNQGLWKIGKWNGKTYTAKARGIEKVDGCVRIYVDGDEIHCKEAEIQIISTGNTTTLVHNAVCPHCGTYCYGDCGR